MPNALGTHPQFLLFYNTARIDSVIVEARDGTFVDDLTRDHDGNGGGAGDGRGGKDASNGIAYGQNFARREHCIADAHLPFGMRDARRLACNRITVRDGD